MAANHQAQTFTFQFDTIRPGRAPASTYRQVPAERFAECFDKAADWVRAGTMSNQDKPLAQRVLFAAYVYGPGLAKRPVSELYRPEIERRLEELGLLALDRPRIVALLWADLGAGYRAYKVRKSTEVLDGFERPHVANHDLVPVEHGQERLAFGWAADRLWWPRGLWLDQPALLFCQYVGLVEPILQQIPQVSARMPDGKVVLAPCDLDRKGEANRPYPYIRPTRSRAKIQDHRARWPNAGEDLLWVPKEILIRRYGYGRDGLRSARADGISPLVTGCVTTS